MTKYLCMIYPVPSKGSTNGLVNSVHALADVLSKDGYRIEFLQLPAFDRTSFRFVAYVTYIFRYMAALARIPSLAWKRPQVYLAPGQTILSVMRDLPPYCLLCLLTGRFGYIALHGSIFMEWDSKRRFFSRSAFSFLFRTARGVSVLGERQKRRVIEMGARPERVHIVPNTTTCEPVSEEFVSEKQSNPDPLRLLFLSLLVDAKGYPEYLEALELISRREDGPAIDAVLCGPLTQTAYSDRFANCEAARQYIGEKLRAINASRSVRVTWIEGAFGEARVKLYRDAHIFVLPTHYRVEAAPLSIIEAMAGGAAVISTTVGEIPYSFGSCAVLLDKPDAAGLADAILELAGDETRRKGLSLLGLALCKERHTQDKHFAIWRDILEEEK